jgi:hypothetical protein
MNWDQRIANYVRETGFPKSLFVAADGRIVGTWIMGEEQEYRAVFVGMGYLTRRT